MPLLPRMKATAFLALCGACAAARPAPLVPLRPGLTLTYRGTVVGAGGPREVTWRVMVRGVAARGDDTVAQVTGDPADLAFYSDDTRPQDYLIVLRGGALYRAPAGKDASPDDLVIPANLAAGMRFCTSEPICWEVTGGGPAELAGVRGAPGGERRQFTLTERDNTGTIELDFVPGVGVTRYFYHHHGSPGDVDVRLVAIDGP